MIKRYGPNIIDELQELSKTPIKYYRSDYIELIESLEKKLENL